MYKREIALMEAQTLVCLLEAAKNLLIQGII